jgi:DNA primase
MRQGLIPQPVIDEVLRRTDIAEVVGRHVHLSRHGKYLKGLCPFHSEKTPSFTVTPEKQIFYCYGCGKGGHVIRFVMEMEGLSFPEAVRKLAEEAGLPVTWEPSRTDELSPRSQEREWLYRAHEHAQKLYRYLLLNTEAGKPAMAYLRSRGFTDRMIEAFGIGYAPDRWDTLVRSLERQGFPLDLMEKGGLLSRRQDDGYVDRFRDRIMFPITDGDGRVIAFAGRLLGDGQPKYLNSPETPLFNKSRVLYRLHEARAAIRKTKRVVLFEGYVDCIKAWSAGVENGVATMGTALTAEHATLLRRYAEEAVICYDGDDAGQAAAHKSIPLLENAGFRVLVAMLPNRNDPDEYIAAHGAESFRRNVLDAAVSAVKFQLIYLRKSHILLEEDGKIRYLRDAVRIVAKRDSPTEREMLLKELSREFDVSLESLQQECLQHRQNLASSSEFRDIPRKKWNTEGNGTRASPRHPPLLPAHVQAERRLIAWMLADREVAATVEKRLGSEFHVADHAALAAYLYAYYAQGNDPDVGRFLASLEDERLERLAGAIALEELPFDEQALEDCLRTINRAFLSREIERKKEEMLRAEKIGDIWRAAQIGEEIIALEKRRKEI